MEKLKIALVGTGGWAREHARILSLRPDVEFCGIAGRNAERTAVRAAEYGTKSYIDVTEMIEKEKPDLVCVCLPNEHHFDKTMEVIKAGIPLIVEKPFVFEMSEADQLLDEAAKRNLFFSINFNHRYAKPLAKGREAIDAGRLGDIVFATWRFGGDPGTSAHPQSNLIETQCHAFDQLEFLCGKIVSINADMTDITGRGFSTMALSLRFENGAVGSLLGTYDSSYAYRDTQRIEVNGTKGRILIEDTVRQFQFQAAGNETAEVWQAGYFNDLDREFHRTFDRHMDDILASFRAGKQPPIHAEQGRRALKLAFAAIESFETGRRVDV
jgi:predicted dehydrogenase